VGASYGHTCDKCGFFVGTSGLWEFYRDRSGKRKPYGHPGPCSDEAAAAGIAGLSADLYCTSCGNVSELIVVEFKEPAPVSMAVWAGHCEAQDKYKEEGAVRCPHCGGQRMILESDDEGDVPCPKCADGILKVEMNWIS
jgi:Zn finger protein HypA/HybF involved in hydrogenase expression